MRVLIQRVKKATVTINNTVKSEINRGLLVFVGIENADNEEDIEWLGQKIVNLRIFNDEKGIMNKSITDCGYEILIVSQFTLHASTKKGNRPSYIHAAKPDISLPLYDRFCANLSNKLGKPAKTGEFGAEMEVSLINDGPVTIWIDSKNKQ